MHKVCRENSARILRAKRGLFSSALLALQCFARTIFPYDDLITDEDLSSIWMGKSHSGGGCEHPHSRAARCCPGALTLQYSSMGFSLFTATSRTWLLRNRILPEEKTDERGGLGASPAMWDSETCQQIGFQPWLKL